MLHILRIFAKFKNDHNVMLAFCSMQEQFVFPLFTNQGPKGLNKAIC